MQVSIGSISNVAAAVALCAMFVIVLACVHGALKRMSFFGDVAGWVVTVCVALLSIVGLVRFFGSPELAALPGGEPRETGGLIDVILVPYLALAVTILLMLLLLPAGRLFHSRETRYPLKEARRREASTVPCLRRDNRHRRETKLSESSENKQIIAWKDGEVMKKTDE